MRIAAALLAAALAELRATTHFAVAPSRAWLGCAMEVAAQLHTAGLNLIC